MLVRVIKKWTSPDLMRQTSKASGCWGDVRFTLDPVEHCDAVVVLNHVAAPTSVRCSPDNIWVLMQEPYIRGVFDWMVERHDQYEQVFTHHLPKRGSHKKYICSQPALPWHVNKNYDELKAQGVPEKQKDLSWITSNLTAFPGHKVRMEFLEYLQSRNVRMDLYGKGINFIEDKWDGLAPYRYSLAIENDSGPDYWTEKVADCFLSWTVPIYYGCTNLEEYFPAESFIRIDINQPEAARETIEATLAADNWEARLPAIEEARKLVLDRHQFFPHMQSLADRYHKSTPSKDMVLQPYRERNPVLKQIHRHLARLIG